MTDIFYDWTAESMLEVELPDPDAFLKICETLTRIGIASKKEQKLWQSCHLLHKQGKYYIVQFKELFLLDGKYSDITVADIERRNTIAYLLQDWELLTIVHPERYEDRAEMSAIKVLPYKEKKNWK
jgi:hypothetical protein